VCLTLGQVARRLDAAAELYRRARRKGRQLHIITNGGGTSHKPRWRDAHGYSVPEAQLMAEGLRERGVALTHVVLEGLSDDTIGNAFCARALHLEWRSDWRSLLLITSDFQLPRAEAVYRWVLALEPKKEYALCVAGVPDSGTMDAEAQASRAQRECASLRAFLVGVGAVYSSMEQVQSWMFSTHDAYAPRSKPRATLDAATLKTY